MKVITKTTQWSVVVLLVFQCAVNAQIKIGDNPTVINSSAIMEMESANKGLLLPRLSLISTASPQPLSQHVAGMAIYNTGTTNDVTPGFYYNDGTHWIAPFGVKANSVTEQFIIASPTNTFVLKNQPTSAILYVNGTAIDTSAYSINGNVLTYINNNNYNYQLVTGDKLTINYMYMQ